MVLMEDKKFSGPEKHAFRSAGPVYVHCLHGQDRTGLIIGSLLAPEFSSQRHLNGDHGIHALISHGLQVTGDAAKGMSIDL